MPEQARSRPLPLEGVLHLQSRGALEVADLLSVDGDELRVAAPRLPPVGTPLRLRLAPPDGPRILASGELVAVDDDGRWRKGAGIRIDDLDPESRARIAALAPEEATTEPEVVVELIAPPEDARLAFRVTYHSADAFLHEYRSNLERGGLFLATEEALERLSPVAVELALPGEPTALTLRGTVVYRVEADPDRGKLPGLGIHFRQGDDADLAPVHDLARRLGDAKP